MAAHRHHPPESSPPLQRAAAALEHQHALDPLSSAVHALASVVLRPRALRHAVDGSGLGHPMHPALVVLPIGSWTSAALLDAMGPRRNERAVRALTIAGLVSAVPTVASGLSDFEDIDDPRAARVASIHMVANATGAACQIASLTARRRGARMAGRALALAALACIGVGGYLGGHLAYRLGVGVATDSAGAPGEDRTRAADPGAPIDLGTPDDAPARPR